MKKIVILPGVRFHSEYYLDYYINNFPKSKIYIFTSTPKYKFAKKDFIYVFVPFFFKIFFKILRLTEPQLFKRLDQKIFMNISNLILFFIKPDLIHSWGGISQKIFFYHKKSLKIVERSSTFLPKQLKNIKRELSKYKIDRRINYDYEINEFYKEVNYCNFVFVPSKYVYKNYPKNLRHKLAIIYPFSSKLYNHIYKKNNKTKKIIGYVGSNIYVKGLLYLIDSFNKSPINNDYIIWLKIDRKDLNSLGADFKSSILNNDKIIICGSKMNMEYFYSSINVLIQPSIDDGFNMVTIESLSAGIPTFANSKMGSCEFLFRILPNNIFDLKSKKNSLNIILNSINSKDLYNQSIVIKKQFNKVYEEFSTTNFKVLDSIFKK